MIVPCIDLMGGKVVQLVQGREKALEGESPDHMLQQFSAFSQIQVIDLDAAMGRGDNTPIVTHLASKTTIRVGGGVRSVERARQLCDQGAHRVIIGTAAFTSDGPDYPLIEQMANAIGVERLVIALDSKNGNIVVRGWQESTRWTAVDLIGTLSPFCGGFLCTYVDKEGMMQGTDLAWFRQLRERTDRELTAAGGITTLDEIAALSELGIDCALGMSIYTGRLSLKTLAELNASLTQGK